MGWRSPLPEAPRWCLAGATVPSSLLDGSWPGDLAAVDLVIEGGRIAAVTPAGSMGDDLPVLDVERGMVWPAFVDCHTHLDKGQIWARRPNPDGSFQGALEAVQADSAAHWTVSDVHGRMCFGLRCAWAHGTAVVRTHIDSTPPQDRISWPVFAALRDAWAGRIDLQAAALIGVDQVLDDHAFARVCETVRAHGGIVGAYTFMMPHVEAALDRLFRHAAEQGIDLDFHADETGDPDSRMLGLIADAALRHRFEGRVLVGHCCSLARQPADLVDRTLDRVAAAGLAVVTLPMCNMYLQDRAPGITPRWRGVTLLHEMKSRGIPVTVASDNTRDPFYAYGDLDALEVYREATRILHLDHPVGDWPRAVTSTPAEILGRPDAGRLKAGAGADLVLFGARSWTELMSRPQSDRRVIRHGRAIDTTLPDYRELDALLAPSGGAAA
jgi:cytosine deaminase